MSLKTASTHLDELLVRELATAADPAAEGAPLVELMPRDTVRTFRLGPVAVRIDMDPVGMGLDVEARALQTLNSSGQMDGRVPQLLTFGTRQIAGQARLFLTYRWIEGHTLDATQANQRAKEIGVLLAQLHRVDVFDQRERFPNAHPLTLLEAMKTTGEALRNWTLQREQDGLGQDLLTLTLSDIERTLRRYTIAQNNHFLTRRRKVLCHGYAAPSAIVERDDGTLILVNYDRAYMGDPAEDLAACSIACELSEKAEEALLEGYLDHLQVSGVPLPHFLPRFFARRYLGLFSSPIERLEELMRIKTGQQPVIDDPVVALEALTADAYEKLTGAMNGLRDLVGDARPLTLAEVISMGRLCAYEELVLKGRLFHIALSGQPYSGKTEVGAALAQRLGHTFVNSQAMARALAFVERQLIQEKTPPKSMRTLVKALFERDFEITPSSAPPYYHVHISGEDVTQALREHADDRLRGATLLDDESVRAFMRDALSRKYANSGIIIEGPFAHMILPGRVRDFFLTCDASVRRNRLMSHRDLEDEDEADRLLQSLDSAASSGPPKAIGVDVGSRSAAAAALAVISELLPPGRRPTDAGLSGREMLYTS